MNTLVSSTEAPSAVSHRPQIDAVILSRRGHNGSRRGALFGSSTLVCYFRSRRQENGAMSGSNPPGAASADAAAEGGIVERRAIPRIFVSERTL